MVTSCVQSGGEPSGWELAQFNNWRVGLSQPNGVRVITVNGAHRGGGGGGGKGPGCSVQLNVSPPVRQLKVPQAVGPGHSRSTGGGKVSVWGLGWQSTLGRNRRLRPVPPKGCSVRGNNWALCSK